MTTTKPKTIKVQSYNAIFTYHRESKDLTIENDKGENTISGADMAEMARQGRNTNRIHKPLAILFWTDCKNGKSSNWSIID